MKTIITVLLFLFTTAITSAQESDLSIFENLTNKVWKAEGNWGDGSKFKQEIIFKFDLDSTIVIAKSKGFTNKEQTKYGPRNHGIRKYDVTSNTIKFWEFDTFGGLTEGKVIVDDKNILYQYQYGESIVTDMWEFVDENTYNFKVGNYEDGTWKQVYLETQFKAKKTTSKE
ncbi:hypothetical protein U6A24_00950 [Aquimarina gracilis]|uniref:Uncharacterized protein n=1 Tax=Aquimarina gracilis TaxID=874422 RepID=A0ABU5ZPH2_9FLAO|nr:hypothetical protein [Aquimarina gracilis]MEB3344004.1 hypothetical protein [Aquimarina gracilis]